MSISAAPNLNVLTVKGQSDGTSDTANVNAAVSKLRSDGGGTIIFEGDVKIESEVVINFSNVRLTGARGHRIIPAFSNASDESPRLGHNTALFKFQPDSASLGDTDSTTGLDYESTSSMPTTTSDLTLATGKGALLRVGEWISVRSDKTSSRCYDTSGGTSAGTGKMGQALKIGHIDGDTITFANSLHRDIDVTTSLTVYRHNLLCNISVDSLVFENPDDHDISLIKMQGVMDSRLTDIWARRTTDGIGGSGGVILASVFGVVIEGYKHDGVTDKTKTVSGTTKYAHQEYYGILVTGVSDVSIVDAEIFQTRHSISVGDSSYGDAVVRVRGGYFNNIGSTCIDTHRSGFLTLDGAVVECRQRPSGDTKYDDNPKGVSFRSGACEIANSKIRGNGGLVHFQGSECTIRNSDLFGDTGGTSPAIQMLSTVQPTSDNRVLSCTVHSAGRYAVDCRNSARTIIRNNEIYNISLDSSAGGQWSMLHMANSPSTAHATDFQISDNLLRKSADVQTGTVKAALECDRNSAAPTIPGRFYNNDCRGYGTGDDGVDVGTNTRSDYVADAVSANVTD